MDTHIMFLKNPVLTVFGKFHPNPNMSQHHFFKTQNFFCYLSYFCYKTFTGCLEQQQKYNIQFICHFFSLMRILLKFLSLLIVPQSQMARGPPGLVQGENGWGRYK